MTSLTGKTIIGFSAYPSACGQDSHSKFADPLYDNITTTPYNSGVTSDSPAIHAGTNLGLSLVGVLDYAGNARVNANGQINMGA